MNIKNFISNIFSSAYKRKQNTNNDKNSSNLSSKEENLLSNLRKSKLFLDDSDVGLQTKPSPASLQSITEDQNNQALLQAEKIVGLMPSSNQSSKKNSKSKVVGASKIQNNLFEVAEINSQVNRSQKKEENLMDGNIFNQSGLHNNEGYPGTQLIETLLRSDTKKDENTNNTSKNNNMICEFNDNVSNESASFSQINHLQQSNKNENQHQNSFVRNSFSQLDSKVIDNSMLPGVNSNLRRCTDANQKLMSAFTFNEEALPAVSLVYNNNSRVPNLNMSEINQTSHISLGNQQNNIQSQASEVDLSQQKCISSSDSSSSLQQPIQLQSVQRGSSSSRVRGSSSKKKAMVSDSPISTKGKRDISQVSFEKYPMLEQIRENISSIIRYQPQVKEDVEGENEGAVVLPTLDESMDAKKKIMEDEDQVHILNLSAAHSRNNQFLQSSQKQFDCLSNKAEPPTQMKQRSNSFFFDQSGEKKKFFNLDEIGSKKSNISSHSSSKNSDDKKMFVESPFPNPSFKKSPNGVMEPEISNEPVNTVPFCEKLNLGEQNNINDLNENSIMSKEGSGSKSDYKCKSSGSSPSRVNLNSFHKNIDMMIDKSEIPPPQLSRSAHKVPSPIKEVDELSQKNPKVTPKRNEMEIMENVNEKEENINNFEGSPKMRQKSVKFDSFTPYGEDNVDDDQHKQNQKLQSRKPTPYNPFKSQPISYLSRQNKFRTDESSSQSSQESNNEVSSQNNAIKITTSTSTVNTDVQPKGELNLKYPPIFKDTEVTNNKNDKTEQEEIISNKSQENGEVQSIFKSQPSNPIAVTPNSNNAQKKIVKLPIALQKKNTIQSAQSLNGNNFFRVENTNSTPTPFHNTSNTGGSTSSGSSGQSNNVKNNFNGITNKLFSSTNSGASLNIKKRRPDSEDQVLLSDFVSGQRIKTNDESSMPLPRQMQIRGTMLGGSNPSTQIKSAYKTCIYCQNDIKPKDEVKTFTCCHKAHMCCLPKDKNVRCLRCNSNNLSNKYRPKE